MQFRTLCSMSFIQVECGNKNKRKRLFWGSLRGESSVEPTTNPKPGCSTVNQMKGLKMCSWARHFTQTTKTIPTSSGWAPCCCGGNGAVTVLDILPPKCFRRCLLLLLLFLLQRWLLCTSGLSLDHWRECMSREVGWLENVTRESLRKCKRKKRTQKDVFPLKWKEGVESNSGGNAPDGQAAECGSGVVGPGCFCVHVFGGCEALVCFLGQGQECVVRVFTLEGGPRHHGPQHFQA